MLSSFHFCTLWYTSESFEDGCTHCVRKTSVKWSVWVSTSVRTSLVSTFTHYAGSPTCGFRTCVVTRTWDETLFQMFTRNIWEEGLLRVHSERIYVRSRSPESRKVHYLYVSRQLSCLNWGDHIFDHGTKTGSQWSYRWSLYSVQLRRHFSDVVVVGTQ